MRTSACEFANQHHDDFELSGKDDSKYIYQAKKYLIDDQQTQQCAGNQFSRHAIAKWLYGVLSGLQNLHSHNPPLVHGKLTIASLFLRPTNALKIMMPAPFPAHARGCLLRYFTPPEVLQGIRDPRGDIWMFGIVALYAATRTRPFRECRTPMAFIEKLISRQLPEGIQLVTDLELVDLICQCFCHMMKDRLPHSCSGIRSFY
jgi:WNK lysine deficient protein kinase